MSCVSHGADKRGEIQDNCIFSCAKGSFLFATDIPCLVCDAVLQPSGSLINIAFHFITRWVVLKLRNIETWHECLWGVIISKIEFFSLLAECCLCFRAAIGNSSYKFVLTLYILRSSSWSHFCFVVLFRATLHPEFCADTYTLQDSRFLSCSPTHLQSFNMLTLCPDLPSPAAHLHMPSLCEPSRCS